MPISSDVPEQASELPVTTGATEPSGYWRYNSPPNWPAPPSAGWTPTAGWQPDSAWGPAPNGWQFWLPAAPSNPSTSGPLVETPVMATPSETSQRGAPDPGSPPAQDALRQSAAGAPRADLKIGMFGARNKAKELASENARLQEQVDRLGILSLVELEERTAALAADLERQKGEHQDTVGRLRSEQAGARAELAELQQQVVTTRDALILQEVGVYDYTHPLDDSVAFKAELAKINDQVRAMVRKDGGAVTATKNMTMDGSQAKGKKMVNEFSKLLLRAYNNEADNLVRGMRPYKLDTSKERLTKAKATIVKLGQSMDIDISAQYHRLRLKEMELTADYLEKAAEEKERERDEKARLREERAAQAEFDRDREKLRRERTHYENAMAALEASGDTEGVERMRAELAEIDKAIADVDYRAANIRAGYVYVISNLGAFGGRMVKVGMTRRQEPRDRVKELSDASVPFNFDVHAIHFSNDAVGVEAEMHRRLADRRVNLVNRRREFFYATPVEVREMLVEVAGDLLEFTELPEAAEYHQSVNEKAHTKDPAVPGIPDAPVGHV